MAATAALAAGRVSAEELARDALAAIEQLNPRLGAVTDLTGPSAIREARNADKRRARSAARGPLDGIPMLIKDCIDTRDAVCSSGLPFLADRRPGADAAVVQRLRRAGAVILGVSATDPGTFGVRTAAVTHPQAPGRTVGGSSGGSAAALAAGFCLAALGTDTGGSIRIPSACCLTAGFKPTYDRLPRSGSLPLAPSADHIGPMTRRAADLDVVARALDRNFHRTSGRQSRQAARIGHAPAYWQDAAPEVAEGVAAALDAAHTLGSEIREVILPGPDAMAGFHVPILAAESAAYHFETFPDSLPLFQPLAQSLFDVARRQHGYDYVQACGRRLEARQAVDAIFDQVDFLILPTLPVLPPLREAECVRLAGIERDFTWTLVRYTALFDHTGHPVVSLPAKSIAPGIGSSVQVVGAHDRDRDVIAFAANLERELALPLDWTPRA
jgi:Asp-tRNA(Asn)/Glu-tRNA(Gln) amidotransferase A subunit family amidase